MMIGLAAATVRQRWVSLAGSFLAVAGGVAIVVPMLLVLAAAGGAQPPGPQRFAAAPAVVVPGETLSLPSDGDTVTLPVSNPRPLQPALVSRLAATGRIVVDWTLPVQAGNGPTDQVGHGWSSAALGRYQLVAGHAPESGQVVLNSGTPAVLGHRISIRTPLGRRLFVVSGIVRSQWFEDAMFFSDADAARMDPVPDAVAAFGPLGAVQHAAAGQATVLTGSARSQADPDPSDGGHLIVGTVATAGITVAIVSFVAACVVFGTFAFIAELRHRELALLRLAGMTAGQVRRLVVTEAAVTGAAGALIGSVTGAAGGSLAGQTLVHAGIAPAWFTVGWSLWPLLAGFGAGVCCALAGSSLTAWQAGRIGPIAALGEAAGGARVMTRSRWLAGLTVLACALALSVYTIMTTPLQLTSLRKTIEIPLLFVAGFALLLPVPLAAVARALISPLRRRGASVEVVVANVAYAGRRTAATAGAVVVAAGVAAAIFALQGNATQATAYQAATTDKASYYITAPDGTVPPAAVTALHAVPGTQAVPIEQGTVNIGTRAGDWVDVLNVELLPPAAVPSAVDPAVLSGTLRDFGAGGLIVDQQIAAADGLSVGTPLAAWGPDGSRRDVTVTAIVRTSLAGIDGYVSNTTFPAVPDSRVDIVSPAAAGTIRAALADLPVTIRTPGQQANTADQASVLLVTGLALIYSVIAVANAMAIASSGRRFEFLALRLAGATRSQVLRLAAAESAVSAAIGTVAALVAGLALIAVQRIVLAGAAGNFPPYLPWLPVGVVAAASAAIGVLASVSTAARAMRDPAAALAGAPE